MDQLDNYRFFRIRKLWKFNSNSVELWTRSSFINAHPSKIWESQNRIRKLQRDFFYLCCSRKYLLSHRREFTAQKCRKPWKCSRFCCTPEQQIRQPKSQKLRMIAVQSGRTRVEKEIWKQKIPFLLSLESPPVAGPIINNDPLLLQHISSSSFILWDDHAHYRCSVLSYSTLDIFNIIFVQILCCSHVWFLFTLYFALSHRSHNSSSLNCMCNNSNEIPWAEIN